MKWLNSMLLLAAVATSHQLNLPERVGDASVNNYVRLVINNLFADLATGIPELGIPSMDPLRIINITIPTLIVPGGSIDAQVSSVEVGQLSQLALTSLNLDFHALVMDLRSILPSLKISGSYKLKGNILKIFPLYGDGAFLIQPLNLVMLGGGSLAVDNQGHVQLTSIAMDTNFTTMVVDFENLLGGGDLGDTLNLIMTNLGTSVFNQIKPFIIDVLSADIIKVVNLVLSHLPPL